MTDGVTEESDRETAEVLTRIDNGVGLITLNRPKAINSLNQTMVDALSAVLTRWADDAAVRAVVLSGAGERGLCAGGDIVAVYHSARKDGVEVRKFWRDEYLLNGQIGRFAKPYVSLMDGIVMGGGVGVSAHGSVRVVTETSKVAMPEVGIGFVPDVGGAFLLSRAPGALGLYAALTGAPFSGSDAIALGFADHYVPHERSRSVHRSDRLRRRRQRRSPPTPSSRLPVNLPHNGIGSTSALPVTPSRTSSPRCADMMPDRPTTPPT